MSYIIANNKIHTNPPAHKLEGGQEVGEIPEGIEKCDICFGLPR